ncbi:SPOR domain-containing protein [Auritidibacter ignavus]|uniref:SPOR domain-containing protein n=1 Tax=Auritidibacter ignavus TaxID=678932 RepID=UPI002446C3BC|nr:SPOR domain-containing protein [Auritidibacter ignavus]WGH86903.1 SPOR domain-containing protein [Auritidibacter ignavus]WGH89187.1 SPOR domain-containing protein [Auritidibacter ignavus]
MTDSATQYWFNAETHEVEKGPQSNWRKLLGPFETAEQARRALEKVQENNERWDAEDEAED